MGFTTDDTTAPTVKSTVPASNATGVAQAADVTATFSEAMAASSIYGTTFKLRKKSSTTNLAAAISYDSGTRTATLDPNEPLRAGITYKAIVTTGTKDLRATGSTERYQDRLAAKGLVVHGGQLEHRKGHPGLIPNPGKRQRLDGASRRARTVSRDSWIPAFAGQFNSPSRSQAPPRAGPRLP